MNYNFHSLQGLNVDDMVIVERLGLNPEVAYTPQISYDMVKQAYYQNVREGMPIEEATDEFNVDTYRMTELLAQRGLLHVPLVSP